MFYVVDCYLDFVLNRMDMIIGGGGGGVRRFNVPISL